MIDLNKRVVPAPETLAATANEELVFLSVPQGKYFGLDASGAIFWRALIESPSINAAIEKLQHEFDTDRATLERDCAELVEQLVARKLATLQ